MIRQLDLRCSELTVSVIKKGGFLQTRSVQNPWRLQFVAHQICAVIVGYVLKVCVTQTSAKVFEAYYYCSPRQAESMSHTRTLTFSDLTEWQFAAIIPFDARGRHEPENVKSVNAFPRLKWHLIDSSYQ